ncbi:MAG: hypothetical protein RR054_05130 [Clostridia bacterium]
MKNSEMEDITKNDETEIQLPKTVSIVEEIRIILASKFTLTFIVITAIAIAMQLVLFIVDIISILLLIGLLISYISAKSITRFKQSGLKVIKVIPIINIVVIGIVMAYALYRCFVGFLVTSILTEYGILYIIGGLIVTTIGTTMLFFNIYKLKAVNSIVHSLKHERASCEHLTIASIFEFIEGGFMALITLPLMVFSFVFNAFNSSIITKISEIVKNFVSSAENVEEIIQSIKNAMPYITTLITFAFMAVAIIAAVKICLGIGILKIKDANDRVKLNIKASGGVQYRRNK